MLKLDLDRLRREIDTFDLFEVSGRLAAPRACCWPVLCPPQSATSVRSWSQTARPILAEVIGFSNGLAHIVPYEYAETVQPGMPVMHKGGRLTVPVGKGLLGRVVDGLGRPLDGGAPIRSGEVRTVRNDAPGAMVRARVREPFVTGQRALDGLLTFGRGQRVGIFAGSGVGKSTLLGEIAKGSDADVTVIALIGERGREVRPFLDDCLGPEGLKRSVVVVATCEQSPLMRVRAAQAAITMADYYRESGANVVFMLDSLTRLAMAQRELGLSLGEPPSARGYTPSVFHLLATTVERLGNAARGSITGILTVLVDGGDLDEPISDAVRSLVDGHIVLDRRLAERGHYPAINIGQSISRVAQEVTDAAHQVAARKLRAILATYADAEDLIRIGAYAKGSSPAVDRTIELMPVIDTFLKQTTGERSEFPDTRAALEQIAAAWPF